MAGLPFSDPLCTVLIPCYNKGDYIAQAIESVLVQREKRLRVLVLDDGSSDHSLKEAEQMAARDARVRVWSRPNKGPVATVNELCGAVDTPFCALLDGDDWWHPHRFEWAMQDFEEHPSLIASFCGMETVNAEGRNIGKDECHAVDLFGVEVAARLVIANCLPASSAVIRTSQLRKISGPFQPCSEIYDWDLWLRLSLLGPLKMKAGIGIAYRKHAGNRSAKNRELLAAQEYLCQHELYPRVVEKYDLGADIVSLVHGAMGQRSYFIKQYIVAIQHFMTKASNAPLFEQEARQLADALFRCNRIKDARAVIKTLVDNENGASDATSAAPP